jgi:hypothetical protein
MSSSFIRVNPWFMVLLIANYELLAASLPRITIDFSTDFHIRKNSENRTAPAWILDFSNLLHRFLLSALWTPRKLLILEELKMQKSV